MERPEGPIERKNMRAILYSLSLFLVLSALPMTARADSGDTTTIDRRPRKVRYYRVRRVRRYPPRHRYVPHRRPRRKPADPRSSFYIGGGIVGDYISETENQLTRIINSGGGFDIFFGFRFNRYFALELGYVGTLHTTNDDLTTSGQWADYSKGMLHGLAIDGKIFLMPSSSRLEPFLQLGGGAYSFARQGYEHRDLNGGGFHLGGGVDIRFNPVIAVGIRALYKGLYLDNATNYLPATENAYFNQFTIGANLQIHF